MSKQATETLEEPQVDESKSSRTLYLYAFSAILFLLPVKFGSSWLTGHLPAYPDSFLFSSFPTSFLGIASALLLLKALLLFKPQKMSALSLKVIGSWLFITISCALFGHYSANMPFYINSVNQMLTTTTLLITAAVIIDNEPRAKDFILGGLCAGLVYIIFNGLYQYFWGFADTRAFFEEQIAQGAQFPEGQKSRIMQTLVYSTFTISNSCAAHIILTAPLLGFALFKYFNENHLQTVKAGAFTLIFYGCCNVYSGSTITLGFITLTIGLIFFLKGKDLPPVAYKLAGILMIIATLLVLGLTRSRAGIVCFVIGILLAMAITAHKRQLRIGAIAGLIAIALLGIFIAPKVASFQVRLGYYSTLINSFINDFWGAGFGSFVSHYNLMKDAGIEESQVPHSFFFGYLGQGGIIAGLAVISCFVTSVYSIYKSTCDQVLKFAVLAGFSSWFLHAQLDFNIMIIGTLSSAAIVALLAVNKEDNNSKTFPKLAFALWPVVIITLTVNLPIFSQEKSYFDLYRTLKNQDRIAALDEVKKISEKISTKNKSSAKHLIESARWAIAQNMHNPALSSILKFEHLKFAEENLLKAAQISPKETGVFTSLCRVYILQKNLDLAQQMLNKAFDLYPYSLTALQLEEDIISTLRQRFPDNPEYHRAYFLSKIKKLEIQLGKLRFLHHLRLSEEELNSILTSLDKTSSKLYTEMDLFDKSDISLKTNDIKQRISEILQEAQKLVKQP